MEDEPGKKHGDSMDIGGISLGRITSCSDGVFAVAITLLVLSIRVPHVAPGVANDKLPHELVKLIPIFEAYVVSFLVIGLFWIGHHGVFSHFKRHDRALLWLNLFFLMFVVFIPFPTSLISEYSDSRVSLIFYAVSIAVAGIMLCVVFWYGAHDNRLTVEEVDRDFYRRFIFGYLDMAVIFLLSIPVAFANTHARDDAHHRGSQEQLRLHRGRRQGPPPPGLSLLRGVLRDHRGGVPPQGARPRGHRRRGVHPGERAAEQVPVPRREIARIRQRRRRWTA